MAPDPTHPTLIILDQTERTRQRERRLYLELQRLREQARNYNRSRLDQHKR